MKRNLFALPLAASALVLFAGCATHDHGAYAPQNGTVNNLEDSARFVLLDPGAQYSVTCVDMQEGRLADGRLQVRANIKNRENRRLQVQANCVFKDAQGFEVETTPFENVFLDENAQQGLSFISANDKAQRYTIRVRQAR